MNIVIVPGYGDATKYIEWATDNWPERYGLSPTIHPFGSTDLPEAYEQRWQEFEDIIDRTNAAAVIGISFGFSIAARALLDHPEQIKKIVSIAGPHDLSALNPVTLDTKYPMLKRSLAAFDPNQLPAAKIMTLRPLRDHIIDPRKVIVPGAQNHLIPMVGHGAGIFTALALKGRTIADFLRDD